MEDRERLMMTILMFMSPFVEDHLYDGKTPDIGQYWAMPEVGDLVKFNPVQIPHRFAWAWLVEHKNTRDDDCWLVRVLGGEEVCRVENASLTAFRGIPPEYLLERGHHRFYLKIVEAFRKVDNGTCALFNGVSWPDRDSRKATVSIRPHYTLSPREGTVLVPVDFIFKHHSRTTVTAIAAAIRSHAPDVEGWGRRKVDHAGGSPFWVLDSALGIELA